MVKWLLCKIVSDLQRLGIKLGHELNHLVGDGFSWFHTPLRIRKPLNPVAILRTYPKTPLLIIQVWTLKLSNSTGGSNRWFSGSNDPTLVFQIPSKDRCLDPQTPPKVRPFRGSFHTDPHKVFGGFWKTRATTGNMNMTVGRLLVLSFLGIFSSLFRGEFVQLPGRNCGEHDRWYRWIPKIGVPQNGWFIMENPIKMDDLGVALFFGNTHIDEFPPQFLNQRLAANGGSTWVLLRMPSGSHEGENESHYVGMSCWYLVFMDYFTPKKKYLEK